MADEDDEETKTYKYEGSRDPGDVVEITESVGAISKTENVTLLGARSGLGKATFPNNDVYEGSFEGGLRNGSGTYTYAAPPPSEEEAEEEERKPVAVYNGAWKAGEKTGVGTMTYTDLCKYYGNWVAGKRTGEGTFYYPNGDIYSGRWEEGKKHGHGTYIYKESQSRLKGTWEMGRCVSGEFTDRYGNTYKGKFAGDTVSVGYALGGVFTLASGASAPSTVPVNNAFAKAGFCPVSYWGPKEPYAGSADHKISVGGIHYCISPANVAAFTASPSKYLPQFGGFCAVGIAHGKLLPVDPTVYKVHSGKLYLFQRKENKVDFETQPDTILAQANAKWITLGHDSRM